MNTQTSLVAESIRLKQWSEQIRQCQNRPSDMEVDDWCRQQGITRANYYYRLRREGLLLSHPTLDSPGSLVL